MDWPTGAQRRAWLDRQGERMANALSYYLGPTGLPERVNALGQALQFTDAGDYVEAADASQALWNDPSLANAARYTAAGAAMALPFIGAQGVNELSNNAIDWLADEDGAIRAWHGSPTLDDIRKFDANAPKRTDYGYLGEGLYVSPQEFIAKAYAGPRGYTHELEIPDGPYKDFPYIDETYRDKIHAYAREIGVTAPEQTQEWAREFADKMRAQGYIGARGTNMDGGFSEAVVFDPSIVSILRKYGVE